MQRALELQHSHQERRREATAGRHNHVRYTFCRDCRSPASEQLLVQLTEQVRCLRTHARGRVDAMPSGGVHTTVCCRRSRIRDASRRLMMWHAFAERRRACYGR